MSSSSQKSKWGKETPGYNSNSYQPETGHNKQQHLTNMFTSNATMNRQFTIQVTSKECLAIIELSLLFWAHELSLLRKSHEIP